MMLTYCLVVCACAMEYRGQGLCAKVLSRRKGACFVASTSAMHLMKIVAKYLPISTCTSSRPGLSKASSIRSLLFVMPQERKQKTSKVC